MLGTGYYSIFFFSYLFGVFRAWLFYLICYLYFAGGTLLDIGYNYIFSSSDNSSSEGDESEPMEQLSSVGGNTFNSSNNYFYMSVALLILILLL